MGKTRPILFSAPMVLAILNGSKTQTRRVLTVPWHKSTRCLPYEPYWVDEDGRLLFCDEYGDYHEAAACMTPYGVAGDRLWVRETHAPRYFDGGRAAYRADWTPLAAEVCTEPKWTPSIFMRPSDSRISLDIAAVRVERLQRVSEADALAEGVGTRDEYARLWDVINGKRAGCAWANNPWVWVIDFARATLPNGNDSKEVK